MTNRSLFFILFFTWSVSNAQFLYNYEQDMPEPEESEQYNPSDYKYNPPSAVEQHFLRTSQQPTVRVEQPEPISYEVQEERQRPARPRRRQTASRRHRPQPESLVEYAPEYQPPPPEYVSEVPAEYVPEERPVRQSRRRQSRPQPEPEPKVEIVEPPKYYGPSAFESIALGQPPAGVYVPHDSLLNLIQEKRSQRSQHQAALNDQHSPENNAIDTAVEPPVQSVSNYRPSPFFVTPPPSLQRQSYVQPAPQVVQPRSIPVSVPREEYVEQRQPPRPRNNPAPVQREEYVVQRQPPRPRNNPAPVQREEYVVQRQAPRPRNNPAPVQREEYVAQQQPPRPRVNPTPVQREEYLEQQPPQTYVQPQPQPRYVPSSQEIQQDDYRRQRRVQQPRPVPQPRARPQRRSRQQTRPVPQPVPEYEDPSPQTNQADASVDYPDDIRRTPRRSQQPPQQAHRSQQPPQQAHRSQQPPQQPRRQQVAVAAAEPDRKRKSSFKPANLAIAELPDDTDEDGIPGAAGVDYPTLHVIPTTSFSCSRQAHNGYYADLETSCQVVHLCQAGGVQDSFLCPNGTIFSQEKFSCQWWYKVNCQNSPRYYGINDRLYKVPGDTKDE